MSLTTFQSYLARLIIEPDFRDQVSADHRQAFATDLSDRERSRLHAIARARGVDINRTLHKGFRLGKLRAMVPFTCQLLGTARLAREVSAFWAVRPPSSFYFIPEAIEFCDYLAERKLRVKYLPDVLAYEKATLEIEKASQVTARTETVIFHYDARLLLTTLGKGRRPRSIPPRPSMAICTRDSKGQVNWQLLEKEPIVGTMP